MSDTTAQQILLPVPRPRGTSRNWMGGNTMLSSFVDVAIKKQEAKKKKKAEKKKMMKIKAEELTKTVQNNLYAVLDSL